MMFTILDNRYQNDNRYYRKYSMHNKYMIPFGKDPYK